MTYDPFECWLVADSIQSMPNNISVQAKFSDCGNSLATFSFSMELINKKNYSFSTLEWGKLFDYFIQRFFLIFEIHICYELWNIKSYIYDVLCLLYVPNSSYLFRKFFVQRRNFNNYAYLLLYALWMGS